MPMLAETKQKYKYVLNPRKVPLWSTDFQSAGLKLGKDLMEKMGWTPGKGLGSKEQGIVVPLRVSFKSDNKGMGFKGDENDWSEQQEEFDLLLSQLTNQTNGNSVSTKKKDIKSLEEKSRLSRARLHYKKFTRGKDISLYSEHDLACILGTKKEKKINEKKAKEMETLQSKEECETSFGVTTISGGSIKDYFKKKWTNFKMKNSSKIDKEEVEEKNVKCDQIKFKEKDIEFLNFAENENSIANEDRSNKKKKNRNHKSTVENEFEERNKDGKGYANAEFNENDSDANKRHKKKMKKKHKKDLDFNEEDIIEAEFHMKTEEKHFEGAVGLKSDLTEATEVFQENVKHKKKKKVKDEDVKTINMNSDEKEVNLMVEEKTKNKKKKHKGRDEGEINVHEKKINADDRSLEEEYTKKKTMKAQNIITEEMVEVESKKNDMNIELINNSSVIEKQSTSTKRKKKKGENNINVEEKNSNEVENYSMDMTGKIKSEKVEETNRRKENAKSNSYSKGIAEEEPMKKKRKNKHKNNSNLDCFLEANKSELVKGGDERKVRKCNKRRHGEKIEDDAVANKENKPDLIDNFTEIKLSKIKDRKKKDQNEKGSQENGEEKERNQSYILIECIDKIKSKKRKMIEKEKIKKSSEDSVTLDSNFIEKSVESDSKKKKIKKEEGDLITEINSDKEKSKSNLVGKFEESGTSKIQKKKDKYKKSEEAESNKTHKINLEGGLEENSTEESGKKKRKKDSKCSGENNIGIIKSDLNSIERTENLETLEKQKKKDKHKKLEEERESKKSHKDNSEEKLEENSMEESGRKRRKKYSKDFEESKEITENLGTSEKQKKKEKHKRIVDEIVDPGEKDKECLDEINTSKSLEINLVKEWGKEKRKKDSQVSEKNNLVNVKPGLNSSEITENIGTAEKQKKKEKHKKTEKAESNKSHTGNLEENSIEESGRKKKKDSKCSEENNLNNIKSGSNLCEITENLDTSKKQKKKGKHKKSEEETESNKGHKNKLESLEENSIEENILDIIKSDLNSVVGMTEDVGTSEKQKKKDKHKKVCDESIETEKKDNAEILDENLVKYSGNKKRKKENHKDSGNNLESSLPEVSAETELLKKKRKKESKCEISYENCIKFSNKDSNDLEAEGKTMFDESTNMSSTKLNNVVHSHKPEFFRGKSGPILPENYSNSRVLGLVCGTDFEKFRGSNLSNFIGYGAKNENGKIYNVR